MANPRKQEYIEFGELVDKFNVTDERIVESVLYLSRQFSEHENVKLKGKADKIENFTGEIMLNASMSYREILEAFS